MSELDNLSDSDWLDIASGRDSDDNDSLSEQESDRDEISTLSRSRRSSISNGDSITSDVEAWEGFVSDNGEEPGAVTGMYPVPLPSPLGAEPIALGDIAATVDTAIEEEEQRVKEALDQSLVGTLSASRSSTAAYSSTPNSIRDLRLSFPDPLTSSRNDLNRSYETVPSPTESTVSSVEDANVLELAPPVVAPPSLEDPGLSTTPVVPHQHQEAQLTQYKEAGPLEIVLYGSPSEIKWKFLHELIEKAAMTSGHALCNSFRESGQTQSISLSKRSEGSAPFFNVISVSDRTADSDSAILEVDVNDSSERPSLAIVYLPAAKLPDLAWHSSYLPVLIPPVNNADHDLEMHAAEDDWDLLAVPPNRVLNLRYGKSRILDAEELLNVDSTYVYEALRNIGRESKKVVTLKPLTEQVKSVNAVTIFALVSIIMGFAFNTSFRPTPAPTPTVNTPSSGFVHNWSFFTAQPNRSILAPCTGTQSLKSGSSDTTLTTNPSIEDTSLSVFNTGSTSLSVATPSSSKSLSISSTSKTVAELTTTSPKQKCHHCGPKSTSSADKPSISTDVVLRSTVPTSLTPSIYARPSGSVMAAHSSGSASTILLAGADRAAGTPKSTIASAASAAAGISLHSVTEALDATTKALAEAVGTDLAELAETADELLMSLREQRDNVIRQSKGKARAFGEQIQNVNELVVNRNERAKKRARELKKKGEDIVRGATKELRERTSYARRRAKALKKRVVDGGTEAWRTYEKSQAEWEATLLSLRPRDENEDPGARPARGRAKNSEPRRSSNINRKRKTARADIYV